MSIFSFNKNSKTPLLKQTRQGAASLYVVIFATILFGVITLSFVRIMLSETSQTGNDDLSESAYDSALAGVEDAKYAVNKYYNCLNSSTAECRSLIANYQLFTDDTSTADCDMSDLRQYLELGGSGEVKVEESSTGGNDTEQAYTCVIISNKVDDYRSTLTSDTPTRAVPFGIASASLTEVDNIEFSWYSETNGTQFSYLYSDSSFPSKSSTSTPPVIALTFIITPENFNLSDFNSSNNSNIIYSTIVLQPSNSGSNTISWNTILNNGNATSASSSNQHNPIQVKCDHQEFACNIKITANGNLPANGNAMVIVSMPYGDTITDFKLALSKNVSGSTTEPIPLENVQVSVDSTGRANQLIRRVETRLDPADLFFPYPEYAVQLDSTAEDSLRKSFWITQNCWTEDGACNNNGQI